MSYMDLTGVALVSYDDHVARQFSIFKHDNDLIVLEMHTIWLPEFQEFVTAMPMTLEAASLVSSLLMHVLHGGCVWETP